MRENREIPWLTRVVDAPSRMVRGVAYRRLVAREGNAEAVIPRCTIMGSQTAPYYLRSRRTSPGDRGGGGGGKGICPRGTRPAKHVPDSEPGWACQVIWIACAMWRARTRTRGSPRSCITSTSTRLEAAYWAISPDAAPGVDGVTWQDYGQDLEANLRDLHARVHRGAYRAKPSRGCTSRSRTGGSGRSGSPRLEDKIVQRAVVEVLNAIYEEDFLGFSYGFRPGRSPHDALDALATGI